MRRYIAIRVKVVKSQTGTRNQSDAVVAAAELTITLVGAKVCKLI
jgi:hypothetical protein